MRRIQGGRECAGPRWQAGRSPLSVRDQAVVSGAERGQREAQTPRRLCSAVLTFCRGARVPGAGMALPQSWFGDEPR